MISDAPANRQTFKTDPNNWFDWFFPDVPAAVAAGRLPAKFFSLDEVGEWVHSHGDGGEPALRMFLISDKFDKDSKLFASVWLQQAEADRVDRRAQDQLTVAREAAGAAAMSAKWTMWAAVGAAFGSFASLVGVTFTLVSDPPEPKVYLLAAPEKTVGPPAPVPLSTVNAAPSLPASKPVATVRTSSPASSPGR